MKSYPSQTSLSLAASLAVAFSCAMPVDTSAARFSEDLDFLSKHIQVVVLSDKKGHAQVAVAPSYQGRIMTSTAAGPAGTSFGWINRDLIASKKLQPHINAFGGEERFWMGPEGGQFSIFFKPGHPFDLAHWQTPAPIDTHRFEIEQQSTGSILFSHKARVQNYSGFDFDLEIRRKIKLLSAAQAKALLGVSVGSEVKMVGYESANSIKNTGTKAWSKDTGLLSIWILGMFNPGPKTTVVIPYRSGPESKLGPVVNDAYFGKVPADRLAVTSKAIFFKGDGLQRGKIGLTAQRAKPLMGSYDAVEGVLTVVHFDIPKGAKDYVNSMWEKQKEPFKGDVANSYNDGPPTPGARPLGPFYELESSSPASALKPNQSLSHSSRTFHFQGPKKSLDAIARKALGVSLKEVESSLSSR